MLKFTKFNEDFFAKSSFPIKWFDKKGVINLKNNLMATIEISTNGVAGHYEKYIVKIISKENTIDATSFKFATYLSEGKKKIEIIDYCCKTNWPEWYINKPMISAVNDMVKDICKYIDTFQTM